MNEAASAAIALVDAPAAERSRPKRLHRRLFLKYVALFFAVVLVALLTSGAFQVWFYYEEHKTSLIRIQREQAEAATIRSSPRQWPRRCTTGRSISAASPSPI